MDHLRYYFFLFLIISISFIRIVIQINIPVFAYLAIILIMLFCCDKNELIACQCSLLPMLGIMQNRVALVITTIGVLLRIKKINIAGLIPVVLMMIWEFFHFIQTHLEIYGFLQDFSPLFALTILLIDKERKTYDYGFIVRSFAFMTIVCSLFNLFECSIQYGYSVFSLGRLGVLNPSYDDFKGLINPNTNSFICLMALSSLLILKNSFFEHKIDNFYIIALFIIILLTQSKSAILCVVIGYFLSFIFSNSFKTKSRFIHGLIGMTIVVAICIFVFSDLIFTIISRFQNGDITTGRNMINLFYFRHIISSPKYLFFGIGLNDYIKQMVEIYPYSNNLWLNFSELIAFSKDGAIVYKPCHLGVLEIIVVWGIPGLFFVYLLFKTMIKVRKHTDSKISLIPLIIIFFYCLQSGFIGAYSVLHSLLIVFLGLKCIQPIRRCFLI